MKKNIKKRLLSLALSILAVLSIFPATTAMAAEDYSTGGWSQLNSQATVVDENGATVGTVYAGEGVTVFYISGDRAYIEYSGKSTIKRGFVSLSKLRYAGHYLDSAVGKITSSCNTYYAPNTNHPAGSVSAGEYVAVLGKTSTWSYIEYNVSGGNRKRAYVPSSLHCYSDDVANYFWQDRIMPVELDINTARSVYAGPNSSTYPSIGSISAEDNGQVFAYAVFYSGTGSQMYYIEYPTANGVKYGYIYNYY